MTKWSKLDTHWEGVSIDTLLEGVETTAEFVVAFSDGGYTTNLPLEDLKGGKAWVAFGYDGRAARARARRAGAPARAAPLLLEEREVGARPAVARGGRAGLLGGLRLPQLRRSMARAAVRGRLTWQLAEVVESIEETPRVKSLVLRAPAWSGHRAGQHVDIRLTAEDGYQVQRSYSIASAPEEQSLVLTVERLDDGEVSPYLVDELRPGDQLELRGPIGGYFAWDTSAGGPLLLVGGGSGIVPLMSILRHRVAAGSDAEVRLLASWRTAADIIYAAELERLGQLDGVEITHTLTRDAPRGVDGPPRAHRRGDAGRGGLGAEGRAAELRVRADRPRRGGRDRARRARPRARTDQDRALRTNRRLRWMQSWYSTGTRSRECSASCSMQELTIAKGTCGACGLTGPLAETRVYAYAPGAVVRCPGCGDVLLTIVKEDGRYWLGFDRLRCLEIRGDAR